MESFEHTGIWWLPEDPDYRLTGTLSFNPTAGGILELIEESATFRMSDLKEYDIIQGFADGKTVTLQGCYGKSMTGFFTLNKVKFIIRYIYIGHYFDTVEDIKFEKLSLGYTHLNEWMGQIGFVEENGSVRSNSFKSVEVEIPFNKDKIIFWYLYSRKWSPSEFSMKNEARITIHPHEDFRFTHYLWYIDFHLPSLLTVATGEPSYPLNITGKIPDGDIPIRIYYKIPGYEEEPRFIPHQEMLFTFEDAIAGDSNCLINWLEKSDWLWVSADLYIQTVYNKSLHPKTKFLLLAQALEAYHRNSSHNGKYLAAKDYNPIKDKLVKAIPDCVEGELRDNLRARINNGNEFSLNTRITSICDEISKNHKGIIRQLPDNIDNFVKEVVRTRNYLTHHPKKSTESMKFALSGLKYIREMQLILRFCFLIELGLPSEKIKELLDRYRRYR